MKLFNTAKILYHKFRVTLRLGSLDVKNAGKEDDLAYIDLANGLRFYGPGPGPKDKKYYSILPAKVKRRIPFSCYRVAMDIVIRFVEGGLKLGGPHKELHYQVKKGDVVAEMGAYMGYYTMYLSRCAGPDGRIIAIEPMPDNLRILKKNIDYNKLSNVTIVEKGVWNKADIQTFYQEETDAQSASMVLKSSDKKTYKIQVNSLDEILEEVNVEEVDLMLIQLNGIEPEALEGLNNFKPGNFAIAARYKKAEIEPVPRIKDRLEGSGYQVFIEKGDYIFATKKGK